MSLLALYPKMAQGVPLSHVALGMVPDDESYEHIAKITGDTAALFAGADRIRLELVPKLIIPIGHLAFSEALEEGDDRDRMISLQERVVTYGRQDTTNENRLKVPARFFAPAHQHPRR